MSFTLARLGQCCLAGEYMHRCCLLTAKDRTCILQDLPVALLLGQRLAISTLAKSKTPWVFLLIVSLIQVALCTPLPSLVCLGQCFTIWAPVFKVTIWLQSCLYLVICVGSLKRKEMLEGPSKMLHSSSLHSPDFTLYIPGQMVIGKVLGFLKMI